MNFWLHLTPADVLSAKLLLQIENCLEFVDLFFKDSLAAVTLKRDDLP